MELIQSSSRLYLVTRVLYESDVCRCVLAEGGDGVLVLLNQITDKALIRKHLHTFGPHCGGFIERFIFRQSLCGVFRYQQGIPLDKMPTDDASALLQICLSVSLGAAVCDLPDAFLPYVLRGNDVVFTDDGSAVWNKRMVFAREDGAHGEQAADILAARLEGLIAGAGLSQRRMLAGLRSILAKPCGSPTELHLAIRRFEEGFRPESTADMLRRRWLTLRERAAAVAEQVLFWAALAFLAAACIFTIVQLTRPADEKTGGGLTQIGGKTLDENGAVEGWYFEEDNS